MQIIRFRYSYAWIFHSQYGLWYLPRFTLHSIMPALNEHINNHFRRFVFSSAALKTSPALHEQRKNLERAKTGDLLRAKIQQRPDRQELERRHILEHEECNVDPSLADKQRMLKKARLADQLNCQISNRPGPLELIKKNILHTEEPIERIVKEGLVSFKATSEGLLNRPQQPHAYITYEDDSQSSEGDQRNTPPRTDGLEGATSSDGLLSVALTIPTTCGPIVVSSPPGLVSTVHSNQPPSLQRISSTLIIPSQPVTTQHVSPISSPPPPVATKIEPTSALHPFKTETSNLFADLFQSVAESTSNPLTHHVASPLSSLSPISSVSSPPSQFMVTCRQLPTSSSSNQSNKSDAPGKDKNRKKTKSKPVPKSRQIKFHEYKGPPNAPKNSSSSASLNEETSYQLLLKQQNFLLEYLEGLHKHPATILPANLQSIQAEVNTFQQNTSNFLLQPQPSPAPSVASSIPASPAPSCTDSISSELTKLEKMKVSDLKLLLKKRNLPVSGPKPQLIERLRPFLPLESSEPARTESVAGETCDMETINSPHNSLSPDTSEHDSLMEIQQLDSPSPMGRATPHQIHHHNHNQHQQQSHHTINFQNDDKLREQQRKIEELQRKLLQSQEELMHLKQTNTQPPPPLINSESGTVMRPDPTPPPAAPQKMVFKQQLEAKIQNKKMMQLQREHANSQQVKLQGIKCYTCIYSNTKR